MQCQPLRFFVGVGSDNADKIYAHDYHDHDEEPEEICNSIIDFVAALKFEIKEELDLYKPEGKRYYIDRNTSFKPFNYIEALQPYDFNEPTVTSSEFINRLKKCIESV